VDELDVSQKIMPRLWLLFGFVIMNLLGSCGEDLLFLRTCELAAADTGTQEVSFTLEAPHRKTSEGYWEYTLGLVLPKDIEFDLSGRVKIYSASGEERNSFRFDSATHSTWLDDKDHISHLLAGKLVIKDGERTRIEFIFDRPLERKTSVVLHFLSHQDTPPQLIEEANKP
jgi:hypothetical protein